MMGSPGMGCDSAGMGCNSERRSSDEHLYKMTTKLKFNQYRHPQNYTVCATTFLNLEI